MHVDLPYWPPAPSEIVWKLRQPSQANRSEFTGARRVTILAEAPRWTAQVKYPPFFGERNIRDWRVALASLQGRVGTFRLSPIEQGQHGPYGNPVVDGAGQIGTTVRTRGWGRGSLMRRGFFVTIGNRLHQVLSESISLDGTLEMKVIPAVAGYADGTEIEAYSPYALMSLVDDEAGWTVGPGGRYDIAFNCEEAF